MIKIKLTTPIKELIKSDRGEPPLIPMMFVMPGSIAQAKEQSDFIATVGKIACYAQIEYSEAKEYVLKKAAQSPSTIISVAHDILDYVRASGRLE